VVVIGILVVVTVGFGLVDAGIVNINDRVRVTAKIAKMVIKM
jgi:hypothetical protein